MKRTNGQVDWALTPIVTKHPVTLVQILGIEAFIINDFQVAKELFAMDIFSHRTANEFIEHHRLFSTGGNGIIFNNGENWNHQRRFSLRTLKDFGFGRKSMEGAMHIEIDEMIERYSQEKGDVKIGLDFNLPIINILWQMVANSRKRHA